MFNIKKEDANPKDINAEIQAELVDDGNIKIHTMQDDLNALSGIFPENEKVVFYEENEKDKNGGKEEKARNGEYFNPFIDKQTSQSQEKIADFASKKDNSANKLPAEGKPQELKSQSSFLRKIVWTFSTLLVIAVFFFAGYYFWNNWKNSSDSGNISTEEPIQKTEEPKIEEPVNVEPVSKYSFDKPNYLIIDVENPTYDNLKSVFAKTFSEIQSSGINKPVEFIVTDNKNNPIAFSIFNVISKAKLSSELLKSLNDKFYLYLYIDSGINRLGLAVDIIDQSKASTIIRSEERKLVEELLSLFPENISLPKNKVVFKDNNYKGVNIRYFNLNENPISSIDYAFVGNQLIIGTSRSSTWMIIDKLMGGSK